MNTELEDSTVFNFFVKEDPKVQLLYDILNEVLKKPITADTDLSWSLEGEGFWLSMRGDYAVAIIEIYDTCPNRLQLVAKLSQLPLKRVIKKGSISCGDVDREWYCLDTGEFYCQEDYYSSDIVKYDVEKFCTEEAEDNSELMNEIRSSCKVPLKPTQYQLGWEEGYKEGLAAAKHV